MAGAVGDVATISAAGAAIRLGRAGFALLARGATGLLAATTGGASVRAGGGILVTGTAHVASSRASIAAGATLIQHSGTLVAADALRVNAATTGSTPILESFSFALQARAQLRSCRAEH